MILDLLEGQHTPWLPEKARGLTKKILAMDRLEELYRHASANCTTAETFCKEVLHALAVRYEMEEADLSRIPKTGPVLLVANHPFGLLEGLILSAELPRVRTDSKVMANAILSSVPQLQETMFFVDILSGKDATRKNIRPLHDSLQWLRAQKGLLAMFPSGAVSAWSWKRAAITDQTWNSCAARLAMKSGATVVPVYFEGSNSLPFYLAGIIHPSLRTLRLPAELANKQGAKIKLRVGTPIPPEELSAVGDADRVTEYLRGRTYALGFRSKQTRQKPKSFHTPVVSPTAVYTMRKEIAELSSSSILAESGPLQVILARARQIPAVLTELGRLREVTFREAGEGTGRRVDLDWFDLNYDHLILWNRKQHEVAGGYRLARTTEILNRIGQSGLYTDTLFQFKPGFFEQLGPAVELGRSFVAPAYQKQYGPLLLLWKGILRYVMLYPGHSKLFGAVSISSDFTPESRRLVVEYLHRQSRNHPLRKLVKPRNPFRPKPHLEDELDRVSGLIDSLDGLSGLVNDLESAERGIPVLLRQYAKMGGLVLAFNVDENFSNVLDGLIVVDLNLSEAGFLRRYGYQRYTAKQQIDA